MSGKRRAPADVDGQSSEVSTGVWIQIPSPMAEDNVLEIGPELRLPLGELEYHATRSGGPGGQHVNTSSTRIELWWDVAASPSLTPGATRAAPPQPQPETRQQRASSTGVQRIAQSAPQSRRRHRAVPAAGRGRSGGAQEAKTHCSQPSLESRPTGSQAPAQRDQDTSPRSPNGSDVLGQLLRREVPGQIPSRF